MKKETMGAMIASKRKEMEMTQHWSCMCRYEPAEWKIEQM